MNIFFRVDSSIQIGTGHVMRCLTLADALREKKANISFICRELPGNLCDFVEKKGFKVYRLPYTTLQFDDKRQNTRHTQWLGVTWETDAEQTKAILMKNSHDITWLVVDHYALDKQWEMQMRLFVKKIMIIDDLADRPHDCDLVLDQNYTKRENRYNRLVPDTCIRLIGPRYTLLRPQFRKARKNLRERDGKVKRILIFIGGADPGNVTCKVLRAIQMLNQPCIAIDVVIGAANNHANEVEALASNMPDTTCYFHVENMAELMASADLSIGAGGTATWERCCVGLPSLVITIAENQRNIAENLAQNGSIINLGWYERVKESDISSTLENLLANPDRIKQMSLKGMQLVDADGTNRVAETLKEIDTK